MYEVVAFQNLFSEFMYLFIRVAAFLSIAPVFASNSNVRLRIGIAVAMTIMVFGVVERNTVPGGVMELMFFITSEVLIGLSMAMILKIAFSVTEVAGHAMSQSGGLSFAVSADPQNGTQIPVIGNFLSVVAILIFLSLNGLTLSIGALAHSFDVLKPGEFPAIETIEVIWKYSSTIFSTAFIIALPVITAVTMSNLAFAIMTRSAPQVNILSIGLPISLTITLIMVMYSMEGFSLNMIELFENTLNLVSSIYG